MSKSELLIALAALPDRDPKLDAVAAVLSDKATSGRSGSTKLLRISDAVTVSGLSRSTIYRLIGDGALHPVEVRRGSRRIPESELQRLAEGGSR